MAHLPSYKQAVDGQGIPQLISSYLETTNLLACARVNKQWHKTFNPLIWADPVRVIARNSNPFGNAYQFLARLPVLARGNPERTCNLITTLDFRPILALRHLIHNQRQYGEYEYLLTTQFLCRTFAHLPNIRFVIFEGLKMEEYRPPFAFYNVPSPEFKKILAISIHGMHELDPNWLKEFPHLVYLDISYTARAENFAMAFNAYSFRFLRVLKMRGLRLTDNLLPPLVFSTDRKLWSLDIRDNFLTDRSVEYLLLGSFQDITPLPDSLEPGSNDERLFEQPPEYKRHWTVDTYSQMGSFLAKDRPDDLKGVMSYLTATGNLTQPRPVLDPSDGLNQPTGLTHLYISDNKLSPYGANTLLYQNRLLLLDIGAIPISPRQEFRLPYTTVLGMVASKPLKYEYGCRLKVLRIHHSIVTCIPTILPSESPNGYRKEHLHHAELSHTYLNRTGPFSPSDNHGISHLTLTDIPKMSYGPTIKQLVKFLDACAEQEALLTKAKKEMVRNRRAPEILPGLRTLRLEFIRLDLRVGGGASAATGDEDAERFLAESMGDFSFFDNEGEGSTDKGKRKEKEKAVKFEPREELLDVVDALKAYRVENKGKWSGKLEIVFR